MDSGQGNSSCCKFLEEAAGGAITEPSTYRRPQQGELEAQDLSCLMLAAGALCTDRRMKGLKCQSASFYCPRCEAIDEMLEGCCSYANLWYEQGKPIAKPDIDRFLENCFYTRAQSVALLLKAHSAMAQN